MINLDLSESDLSDEGLKEVCKCKVLRKLDLNAGKGFRTNISSGGETNFCNLKLSMMVLCVSICML